MRWMGSNAKGKEKAVSVMKPRSVSIMVEIRDTVYSTKEIRFGAKESLGYLGEVRQVTVNVIQKGKARKAAKKR